MAETDLHIGLPKEKPLGERTLDPVKDTIECKTLERIYELAGSLISFEKRKIETQYSSFDGEFIWKLKFRKSTIQLFSPPFYTSKYGYKMCLCAYISFGTGDQKYLSVDFLLMKGEYDDLLKWPFRLPVTIELINLKCSNRSIKQNFVMPSFSGSSNARPHDMNVVYRCPEFAPLSALDDSNFLRDDSFFIKCNVDLSFN